VNECKPLVLGSERAQYEDIIGKLKRLVESERQGVTLVHFSAQPEPFLTKVTPSTPPAMP